jgi:hypothetical protein
VSEITEWEGRISTVSFERVLNACPHSWHASLVTVGYEAQGKAQGRMLHPSVTGKGKIGKGELT